ncbi:MAG: hypothetical protein DA405_02400 [Bacteroidetes bacterium]|nr:MAG: hypothetical protein DA405_02400 [Bacteroidota bacterium]
MNKSLFHSILFLSLVLFSSCDSIFNKGIEEEGEMVARVYESKLYQHDIVAVLPEGLSPEDSANFVQNFINVWAKNELMVYKAEFNLTDEQKQFEEQIRNYRNDLLKYAYLQKYVDDRLDTSISELQIKDYYQANSQNFLLKENILKIRYIVVPQDAPELEDLKKWFKSSEAKDLEALLDYSLSFARSFSLEDTAWISFNDFRKLIPIRTYNQQDFLARNKWIELEEEGLIYLAQIKEFKIKDNSAPIFYVKDIIRNTLLNKKRLDLIADLEKNLVNDALKKKEFETYP